MRSWFRILFLLFFVLILHDSLQAQSPPKRELRAAWIATVTNLDWPTRGADPASQRLTLTTLLDALKTVGINSVVFQVRSECDAMYPSNIEPWSYYLTGTQGAAPPSPFDPLQFALDEAHKRGMEIHAWFNPYRVEVKAGNYTLASNHVSVLHPDWVIQMGTYRFLNPGMQLVRDYTASVIADVVRRYDVDGAHMDDYFYQDGITTQDSFTFQSESRGFTNLGDWRRDNVNLLIKQVYDSIQAIKPNVKWGISPRGIWMNGVPAGITGNDNYSTIFCDAVAWLQGTYIDYLVPQLYWTFGGGQDYAKLAPWWSSQMNGRHFYSGLASYNIYKGTPPSDVYPKTDWPASDILSQVRLNRSVAQGTVYFRAKRGLVDNPKGLADSLKKDLYKIPALRPIMSWKETIPPNSPSGLAIVKYSSSAYISWTAPPPASDGGVAEQYVVYRSSSLPINLADARNILSIQSGTTYFEQPLPLEGVTTYYGVTAVDRLQNESALSNVMGLTSAGVVDVDQSEILPREFVLHQNYPNPFNPSTAVSFQLSAVSFVTLRVYDVLGREVATLVEGIRTAGTYTVQWNASSMPSGMYICRLTATDGSKQQWVMARKMLLVK